MHRNFISKQKKNYKTNPNTRIIVDYTNNGAWVFSIFFSLYFVVYCLLRRVVNAERLRERRKFMRANIISLAVFLIRCCLNVCANELKTETKKRQNDAQKQPITQKSIYIHVYSKCACMLYSQMLRPSADDCV